MYERIGLPTDLRTWTTESMNPTRFSTRLAVFILAVLLNLASSATASAQVQQESQRFKFFDGLQVSNVIPSPAEFLGYEPGDDLTPYHKVEAYIRLVADASDRVLLIEQEKTYEGRRLFSLVITSPENHGRLDEIKSVNQRLATGTLSEDETASIVNSSQPVISWLSYNVHGNEMSSTEAALQIIYHLVAGQNDEVNEWLSKSVIIIDPNLNPDGRDRYVNWYRSAQSEIRNDHSDDFEHVEPFPGGRGNHYWFDLNRDWVWLVHPESRGRLSVYQDWLPQIHIDYHEQGSNNNYFTMPGQTPRNLNLPDSYEMWSDVFGRASAAALDKAQVNYFTRESFDFFYPGYGSSYPSNLGAIGMLAEQGSSRGRGIETDDGYVLTLTQSVFDHYATSLAVIATAAENRDELLTYFEEFFRIERRDGDTSAYILPDDEGRGYLYDLLGTLLKHGIQIEKAKESFSSSDARHYSDGESSDQTFDAGSFIIRTEQPRHVLLNTLMQRQMEIEDSVMYDMATWSAPLAYGLDAYWTTSNLSVSTDQVRAAPDHPTELINSDATYAYAIDWSQRNAPSALAELWKADYRVRFAKKGFTANGTEFSRGTLIVLNGRNLERASKIQSDMQRIAAKQNVRIEGFDAGRVEAGADLASSYTKPIKQPRVGLIVGDGTSSDRAGHIWFLLDQWTGLGIDRLHLNRFTRYDLSDHDVLIFPDGDVSAVLDSSQVDRLKEWVQAGGTLIATEGSASFFTESESGLTSVELVSIQESEAEESEETPARFYTSYEARGDSTGLRRIPGSAMRTVMDKTHPLAFGLGDELYSLKFGTDALKPSESLQTVGHYYPDAEEVLVSGYASAENRRKLAGNTFAGTVSMGQGHVVLLLDNTQYRMFWVGPARMMLNAIMLVPGM